MGAGQDTPCFGPAANSQVGAAQANLGIAQSYSNFRGLGSQRTLPLVNGRRFVSSNTVSGSSAATSPGSQVDLNLIPVGLIERVETIAIGGAPVYGSDAIAGTVNLILKEDYEGLELTGQASLSDRGDAANQAVRALFGRNFAGGRGNIVLAAEYVRQEGMRLSDRFKFRYLTPSGNTDRTDGIPGQMVVDDLRYAALTEGGLPYLAGDIAPGTNSYIRDAAGRPLQFGAGGDERRDVAGERCRNRQQVVSDGDREVLPDQAMRRCGDPQHFGNDHQAAAEEDEIGRASCRERVCQYV